jgi:hypothetical protein
MLGEINRFPDDNPNPVMRVDADGHLIYANAASAAVLKSISAAVGEILPAEILARLDAAVPSRGFVEFRWDNRTYAVWPVPIPGLSFMNLYGMDVTAERAIVKFPDQNPNPVLRIDHDGVLVYANHASTGIVSGLGLRIGTSLPVELRDQLLQMSTRADRVAVEIEAVRSSPA